MKYTAKSYVKIDDGQKRKEVFEVLKQNRISGILTKEDDKYVCYDDSIVAIRGNDEVSYFKEIGFIDCNAYTDSEEEAVKLFLELAKMKDDTHDDQWHKQYRLIANNKGGWTTGKEPFEISKRYISDSERVGILSVELTPLELAEAVRDKKIKL